MRAARDPVNADPKEEILPDRLPYGNWFSDAAVLRIGMDVRSAESVTDAPHRLNDTMADVVKFAPQSTNMHIDRSRSPEVVVAPNAIQDVLTAENSTWI